MPVLDHGPVTGLGSRIAKVEVHAGLLVARRGRQGGDREVLSAVVRRAGRPVLLEQPGVRVVTWSRRATPSGCEEPSVEPGDPLPEVTGERHRGHAPDRAAVVVPVVHLPVVLARVTRVVGSLPDDLRVERRDRSIELVLGPCRRVLPCRRQVGRAGIRRWVGAAPGEHGAERGDEEKARGRVARQAPWQRLNFLPLPHQHGSFRPTSRCSLTAGFGVPICVVDGGSARAVAALPPAAAIASAPWS